MDTTNAQRHIMVIDDSPTVRRIIQGTLYRSGYQVDCFGSGLEAIMSLTRGETSVPDLVLLDIGLPQMDGYSVAKIFRQKSEFKQTIIVMISARDGVIDRIRGHMVGAKGYITKPFKPGDILDVVQNLLQQSDVSPSLS